MADSLVITKQSNGNVRFEYTNGKDFTLLPELECEKNIPEEYVELKTIEGRTRGKVRLVEVEKLVFPNGSEVFINDLDTLYDLLRVDFFLK